VISRSIKRRSSNTCLRTCGRYALRHNAGRHILDSQEEITAADRAVQLLAGYRNLALAK
jgi:hypothetical protein